MLINGQHFRTIWVAPEANTDTKVINVIDQTKLPHEFVVHTVRTLEEMITAIKTMQLAVIEYARNEAKLTDANSTEFNPDGPHPLIGLITEWQDASGKTEQRNVDSDLGGTMRLGAQSCPIEPNTLAAGIYGKEVNERHRHRYEVNNNYVDQLKAAGLVISARTPTENLCEMIELPQDVHPWFVACQFHPEFTSNPRAGHPLFTAYVKAALAHKGIK